MIIKIKTEKSYANIAVKSYSNIAVCLYYLVNTSSLVVDLEHDKIKVHFVILNQHIERKIVYSIITNDT